MTRRPFIQKGIDELEALFEQRQGDPPFLAVLIAELDERKTPRAKNLKGRAMELARAVQKNDPLRLATQKATARPQRQAGASVPESGVAASGSNFSLPPGQPQIRPRLSVPPPPIQNKPTDILSAWTAMEVLSPPGYRRPEDLAGGDRTRIVRINGQPMPWDKGGEKSRPNYRLYYQIILGSIDMEAAVGELIKVYTDSREERPQARGEAALATIMVDAAGRPIDEDPVAISSFGWGVPIALAGNLSELRRWPEFEKPLIEELTKRIVVEGDDGHVRPLATDDLLRAYEWLVTALNLNRGLIRAPSFIVRTYQYFKVQDAAESIILNSFFLDDLAQANAAAQNETLPANLQRYLGLTKPKTRRNLMSDPQAVADALEPKKFPLGSWPANGRHPLVTLQQCAVNLASNDLRAGGILAVNGPPGTGKTTLLRDVLAAIVTERAKLMCCYNDPEEGFTHSGQKLKRGSGFTHLYRLNNDLKGFEVIVASSNNKAVTNVSAELPIIEAIADDSPELRYFKATSDNLSDRETWGAIAAVLGNGKNRSDFRQNFWWDEELGLQYYLQQCSGNPQLITEKTEAGVRQRPRQVITLEKPPENHAEALRRWQTARKKFASSLSSTEKALATLQKAHELQISMQHQKKSIAALDKIIAAAEVQFEQAEKALGAIASDCQKTQVVASKIERERDLSRRAKPGFWHRLLHRSNYRRWQDAYRDIESRLKTASDELRRAKAALDSGQSALAALDNALHDLKKQQAAELLVLEEQRKRYDALAQQNRGIFINADFFDLSHKERQTAAPWLDKAAARLRHDLFEAAIAVHAAFVGAAAKPIRHNINVLMESYGMRSLGSPEKDALISEVWATLFLLVPAISTTFASVSRMFCRIGAQAFGWLLIDEAGQALPQAAVGALMRTQRAVVVGDPIQVEPVVVLPDQLTEAMCAHFGVDPLIYNAPAASVQTLADSATAYFGTFESRFGTREVGVPLLVHRRCSEPMFSLSNSIAYDNLMVQAKGQKPSKIRDALGQSRWVHVQGRGNDKWCPEEGAAVVDLLRRVKSAECAAELYIVTPFVVVQDRLRDLVKSSGILEGWVENPDTWVRDRIGTVHTVQGRESEAVIFVLGAPNAEQRGARGWAGGKPNLLNVAVTRAKEALYIVGNRELWKNAGVFQALDQMLD